MTPEQITTARWWMDDAFMQLQVSKLFIQGDPLVSREEADDAVQHALARLAAARTLLVASDVCHSNSEPKGTGA
jgi:hypothetical protein